MPRQTIQNPDGTFTVQDDAGNRTTLRNADELKKYNEAQGIMASLADRVLERLDVEAMHRDQLHPVQAGTLEIGDLVFVRTACQMGEVQRKTGDAYRVQMRDGRIETRWGIELERRV